MSFPGVTDLGLFIIAGLILNITPGADLLYITSRSAALGKKAGMIAALGIGTGCMVHVAAASLGFSMILASSSLVFSIVKYLGAVYLIYLGIHTLLSLKNSNSEQEKQLQQTATAQIFRQAILINALNPKVALFFMALLPQFVSAEASHPSLIFFFLGVLFTVNGTVINILMALSTSIVGAKLQHLSVLPELMKTMVGTLFVALGIRLAFFS